MKKIFVCLIASSLFLACNNKKNSGKNETASAAEIAETKSELDKKMEELQQLTPYTTEQMKAILPVEINGDSATTVEAHDNMGTGFSRAAYPLNDSTSVDIVVFDCGGPAGAGIYNTQFISQISNQVDNDREYTGVVDFSGTKAIVHTDKRRNNSSLTFLSGGRLLLTLEGKNCSIDDLKKVAKEL
jgi:hypothetical protein